MLTWKIIIEVMVKNFFCVLVMHLFEPLSHVRKGRPVTLNESEFQFVSDLKDWSESNAQNLKKNGAELFLLRNLSRGKRRGIF